MAIETKYKLFPACRKSAKPSEHQHCTGAYIGKYQNANADRQARYDATEFIEVRWQCSCPHHAMGNASVQGDFFRQENPDVPRMTERQPEQGKLF